MGRSCLPKGAEEIVPSRTVSSPEARSVERLSEIGREEEAMVGVLPTLLPNPLNSLRQPPRSTSRR